MPQDMTLNITLKEMWRIDDKVSRTQTLTVEEREFWKIHIQSTIDYFQRNAAYWASKKGHRIGHIM